MNAKLAVTLIVILFVGPIAVSWWLVKSDVDWAARGLGNHGILVRPPIDLRGVAAAAPVFDALALTPSEWAVVNVTADGCPVTCLELHDRLLLIRSVIGSSRERLRVLTVAAEQPQGGDREIVVAPATVEMLAGRLHAADAEARLPQVVVLDWRRQLMLRFPPDAPSGDIQKDLKKLLRASKIR